MMGLYLQMKKNDSTIDRMFRAMMGGSTFHEEVITSPWHFSTKLMLMKDEVRKKLVNEAIVDCPREAILLIEKPSYAWLL